jgi:hypothetical protein
MHPAAVSQSKLCELGSLVLTSMVRDHGQWEKQKVERRRRSAHQSPRCSSGWHGRARPARPARGCLGKSSLSPHREHHTLTLQPVSTMRHKHLSKSAGSASPSTARHRIGGARRQQILRGEITQISSERRRQMIPLGRAGRGCWGEWFAQGGDGNDHRSWPEGPGDRGGDPDHQRAWQEREREGANGAGLGRFDQPRPEPGWLSRAEWAGWASRPVGPAGQMGQIGFGQLI